MRINFTGYFKKYTAAAILMLALAFGAQAQNDPLIAQWMYHTNVFNPSVSANDRNAYFSALGRFQWIGFKEAPATQLFDAYGYISKIRGGLGLVVVNDMLGKQRATSVRVSYAYSQKLADRCNFGIGLSVGFLNEAVKGQELVYQDVSTDQSGIYGQMSRFKPFLGVGFEFDIYNLKFGAAVSNTEQGLAKATVFKIPRHYFGHIRYSWDATPKFNFSPGVFVRSSQFITQADVNMNFTFAKRVTLGVFYRTTMAAGGLLGVNIFKGLFVSYSYDFDFNVLRSYQTGSHEINLSYTLKPKKEKKPFYGSPRYAN